MLHVTLGGYASIQKMLAELENASDSGDVDATDRASQNIQKSVLRVLVRDGWHAPGQASDGGEYEILLSTGGPALRIWGTLDQYDSPRTAELQTQDWFNKPWSAFNQSMKERNTILRFAQQFYFGD